VDGKRKRKAIYGRTRKEVAEQMKALLREQQQGLPIAVERQTIEQFLTRWLEEAARPAIRPRTYDSYAQVIRLYLAPALGHYQLAKLAPEHVQAMLNGLLARGLSPRTVSYARAVLRRALNQAVRWGRAARNVATLTEPPRAKKPQITPLNPEQARTLLDTVRDTRDEALYRVALALGLRMGEILGLRWQDVNLDTGSLTVAVALQRRKGSRELVEPKTERSRRTLPLPPVLVRALRAHRARQLAGRLAAGPHWQDWDLVFPSTVGTPMEPRNLTRQFKGVLAAASLPDVRFHDLRHSCATFLLAQGVNPRVAMEILGHSQISLTLNTYSHVMPSSTRAAVDLVGSLLAGAGG